MAGRTGFQGAALLGATLALSGGACADSTIKTGIKTGQVIGINCAAAAGVERARAAQMCKDLLAALTVSYPDRQFAQESGPPALHVTVTAATSTEAGLALEWLMPDGSRQAGSPFQISTSDRKIAPGKSAEPLTRLYLGFLGMNPLPF